MGPLNNLLTEDRDAFHQEKAEVLPAGLQVSASIQVDDTGARHQGQTGFCTHIGNDLFASFESTDTKSRLSFLEGLRRPRRRKEGPARRHLKQTPAAPRVPLRLPTMLKLPGLIEKLHSLPGY